MEDELPEIRITNENYEANAIIADLNKQLDQKEKELNSKEIYPVSQQSKSEKVQATESKKPIIILITAILVAIIIVIILLLINIFKADSETIIVNNQTINQSNIDENSDTQITTVTVNIDIGTTELYPVVSELDTTAIIEESQTTVSENTSETVLQVETSTPIIETDIISTTQISVTSETVSRPNVLDFVEDTLVIPEGTTEIVSNEYYDRDDITSVIIPEGVTCIGDYAFQSCSNLESVTIPEGVTSIGESAFQYCYNLKEIVIPQSVKSIGKYAFNECFSLNYVTILNEETKLQLSAFTRTPWDSMKNYAKYSKIDNGYELTRCSTAFGNIIIPEGVTKIGDNAFSGSHIQSVIIPSSVTEIGNEVFKGCGDLLYVDIPDSVTIIGDEAFNNCNNLTHITIPESVTSIGEVALPRNWKEAQEQPVIINDILIYYDPEQTPENVVLPDGITEISARAFERNDNIVSITIPQSITKIGYAAFSKCNNLKTVILEGNYEDIEFSSYVFYDCYSFEEIIYNGENVKSKIKFY